MTPPIPVAFYAPLKSPLHPDPSGDRTMARLLMKALDRAGFAPTLASELRTLDTAGDPARQEEIRAESGRAAAALIERFRGLSPARRPAIWFTYHVYYKAPDWIGPSVADALGIPYVAAEGSRAPKRRDGPWALGHAGAEVALDRAAVVLAMTDRDRPALAAAKPPGQTLIGLPPFVDESWTLPSGYPPRRRGGPPALLAVAMMRPGDKLASYRLLAEALGRLREIPWTLDIVGDGPARPEVEGLFAPFGSRVEFHGAIRSDEALRDLYDAADLLVWPAVNEAYGMVLLEAQARGCPVVAGAFGGVPSVVRDGTTGRLTEPGDPAAFADAVRSLLRNALVRERFSTAARGFVAEERSLDRAAERLRSALRPLVAKAVA